MRPISSSRGLSPMKLLLWAAAFLSLAATTPAAADDSMKLFTSSSAYCSVPQVLVVDNAELTLYKSNSTLEFELAAGSIANNINVTVAAEINAYGLGIIDFSIDLCSIAGGLLCPLPTYQFNGAGVFPVPSNLLSSIPTIAYTIPDLEAAGTLQLNSSTGEDVGCVQVTLSNGKTAEQAGAKWALVGVALLALFSSILHSMIAQSVGAAQWRVVDVMTSIQHIALTALLSLNYPVVYVSYALNAAWSIGIVDISSLQSSITTTRHKTGGTYEQPSFGSTLTAERARANNLIGGLVNFTNKTASTSGSLPFGLFTTGNDTSVSLSQDSFSSPPSLSAISSHMHPVGNLMKRATQYAPNTGPDGQPLQSSSGATLPVVSGGNSTYYGGLDLFTQRARVDPHNAFLTVLVSIFIFLAIVVGALVLAYAIALLFRLFTKKSHGHVAHWSRRITRPSEFGYVISATFGRALLVIWPVFLVFAFYQWVHGDSWVPDFLAAIFLAFLLVAILVFFLPLVRYARREGVNSEKIYYSKDDPPLYGTTGAKRWGHMAHPYRPRFFWFTLAFMLMSLIRACFISFAQGRDFTQAVGLLVFEFVFFLILCVFRVGRDKKSDFVFIVLAIFRVATWAVCVVFTRRANVTTIPRVIVGFVLIVITGLPIIWLFFLTLWDLFTPFLPSKRRNNQHLTHEEKDQLRKGSGNYGYGDVGGKGAVKGAGAGAGAAGVAGSNGSPGDEDVYSGRPTQDMSSPGSSYAHEQYNPALHHQQQQQAPHQSFLGGEHQQQPHPQAL